MKSAASATRVVGFIFAGIASIFLIVGLFMTINAANFKKTALPVTAVIADIESYTTRDSDGDRVTKHRVYISYEVDGVTYNEIAGYYHSGMREGGSLEIYVNPDNHTDIIVGDSNGGIVFVVIALVFITVGLLIAFVPSVKEGKKKKLMETGVQTEGLITAIVPDRTVSINHRHPYKAECQVIDPVTGEVYLYSSQGVMENIRHLEGRRVTVYYDPDDRSNYYVDLDSAEEDVLGGAPQIHDFR